MDGDDIQMGLSKDEDRQVRLQDASYIFRVGYITPLTPV
jgi:hypothetical protein